MNLATQFQWAADEIRKRAEAHPFDGDWPPDHYWVRAPGPNGRGGLLLPFTASPAGRERLVLKTEGFSPPKNRTIRRWCTAFWGDFRDVEWETEGSQVTVTREVSHTGAETG